MERFVERHYSRLLFLIWLFLSLALLFIARNNIATWQMGDADDQMRLMEVRDWLGGQSWWDITQYRMNPPVGGPMHWSRLVDVPIAGLILLLRPILGDIGAQQAASAILPLLILGIAFALVADIARHLFGKMAGLVSAVSVFAITPVMVQLTPMRIDHHGWQLVLFLVATRALLTRGRALSAAVQIGAALALWIEISVEGLPFAVLFLGLLGLRWCLAEQSRDAAAGRSFLTAISTFAVALAFFYLVTEGVFPVENRCDELSPLHIAAAIAGAATCLAGNAVLSLAPPSNRLAGKIVICAFAAFATGLTLWRVAPICTAGAFSTLLPQVREYWFARTAEGLPLWRLPSEYYIPSCIGFASALAALFIFLRHKETRFEWREKVIFALLLAGCMLVGATVQRTVLYALVIGCILTAPIVIALFQKAEEPAPLIWRMSLRILAFVMILSYIAGQNVASLAAEWEVPQAADYTKVTAAVEANTTEQAAICRRATNVHKLDRLPPSRLMAGLDVSPSILMHTRHFVVATGHHKNQVAMADVIDAFTLSPEKAKAVFARRKISYLVGCMGDFELSYYQGKAPRGLWAELAAGDNVPWLVRQPAIGPYKIWHVQISPPLANQPASKI